MDVEEQCRLLIKNYNYLTMKYFIFIIVMHEIVEMERIKTNEMNLLSSTIIHLRKK